MKKTIARVILKTAATWLHLAVCYKYRVEGLLFKFILKKEWFLKASLL